MENQETSPPPNPEPSPQRLPSHNANFRNWSMWLHFSGLSSYLVTATPLVGLVAPIVIWQMKKDTMPGIEEHGKNAINFHLSLTLYIFILGIIGTVIGGVFTFLTFGLGAIPVAIAAGIFGISLLDYRPRIPHHRRDGGKQRTGLQIPADDRFLQALR